MDYLEEAESGRITKKTLRTSFFKFCRKHKLTGVSDKAIKVSLESMFGVSEERLEGYGSDWAWSGIKFKENPNDE